MKDKQRELIKKIVANSWRILLGIALVVSAFAVPTIQSEPYLRWIVLAVGCLTVLVAAAKIIIQAGKLKNPSGKNGENPTLSKAVESGASQQQPQQQVSQQQVQRQPQAVAENTSGRPEQKIDLIDRMDKGRFVITIAQIFHAKGFAVRLTSAENNYGVDFVTDVNSVPIAVSCFPARGTLSAEAIRSICQGSKYYNCKTSIFVTNAVVDKTVADQLQSELITVVDRHVLINKFL